jgi:hypothetical protein
MLSAHQAGNKRSTLARINLRQSRISFSTWTDDAVPKRTIVGLTENTRTFADTISANLRKSDFQRDCPIHRVLNLSLACRTRDLDAILCRESGVRHGIQHSALTENLTSSVSAPPRQGPTIDYPCRSVNSPNLVSPKQLRYLFAHRFSKIYYKELAETLGQKTFDRCWYLLGGLGAARWDRRGMRR